MFSNNIKLMSKELAPTFSTDDVAKIKKFCKTQTKDIFDHLNKPLAPNVHGHEYIKKAILCMLLQGNEKVLNNGACIKGDINILLLASAGVMRNRVESCAAHPGEAPTDFTNGLHFIAAADGTILLLLLSLVVTVAVQL